DGLACGREQLRGPTEPLRRVVQGRLAAPQFGRVSVVERDQPGRAAGVSRDGHGLEQTTAGPCVAFLAFRHLVTLLACQAPAASGAKRRSTGTTGWEAE